MTATTATAARAAANVSPRAPKPCACAALVVLVSDAETLTTGCVSTTVRTFAPGHDAKLKGFLIRAGRAAQLVRTTDDTVAVEAVAMAAKYGFAKQVAEGVSRVAAPKKPRNRKPATVASVVAEALAPVASLAETVATEEAAFAELMADAIREQQESAEWDDETPASETNDLAAAQLAAYRDALADAEAEAAETGAEAPRDVFVQVWRKVGRWPHLGTLAADDKTFTYTARNGDQKVSTRTTAHEAK